MEILFLFCFVFFSFALEPKFLFLVVGIWCLPASWLEGKLWYGALLELFFLLNFPFFTYHQLTCLASAEAWGWPELCQTDIKVYLRAKRVPFPFLLHPCCHLPPRSYLFFLLMSGSFGVMWWLFRFTWPSSPSLPPNMYIYIYKICIYFTYIKYIYIHIYVSIFLHFFAC